MNDRGLRVVVVGAGIVGASIAFNLSLRNVELTVVDSHQPGAGATGHSFAYINAFGKDPRHYHDLNRRSMDAWERFTRRLGTDIGLRWGGKMSWESTLQGAEELERRVKQVQAWGYASRMIDEPEMLGLEPGLSPGTVCATALNSAEGHVDAPKAARVCIERVRQRGGTVCPDTQVTGLKLGQNGVAASRVVSVETADGAISCDAVVLAAGLGTTQITASVAIDIPQQESPGVVIRTDPQPPVFRKISVMYAPAIDENHGQIHLRQMSDGTLMIGEGSQESLARDDSQEHADQLLSRARHFLPALSGARATPVPVGYRPMPMDGLPILGFTQEVPNLYVALMHSGVTLAPIVGELSVNEIVDGARVDILAPYRLERFS